MKNWLESVLYMENRILNLGIMAHVDAGKTTLTESLLYHSGIVKKRGSVDKGTTITDSMELEQKRGMTIKASTVSFSIGTVKINLIDTPGHVDFIGEVERCLRALDGVVLVVSAREGVQPQTRILFHQLKKLRMPVILFLNKVDRLGADYQAVCDQIRSQLTKRLLIMQDVEQSPDGCRIRDYGFGEGAFMEQILLCTEKLLERYLDGETIGEEELAVAIRFRTGKGRLYPVYAGSALKDLGIRELMKGIVRWLPSGKPGGDSLCAYIYKVEHDESGHRLAYFRVFSGTVRQKDKISAPGMDQEITVNNLQTVREGKQLRVPEVGTNDIGILTDVPTLRCGSFIGVPASGKDAGRLMEPMLCVNVQPVLAADRYRLLDALNVLLEEDPLLRIRVQEQTGEILADLYGKLQIEILQAVLWERFTVRVEFSGMKTIGREKPAGPARADIRLGEKGNLHRAGIGIRIEPLAAGEGNRYETEVSFGYIEKSFQNAVQEGVRKALEEGLADEVTDTLVVFESADYDSVTSTPADYRRLAPKVVQKALRQAGVITLEPYMSYRLIAPAGEEKRIMGRLAKMQAVVGKVTYSEWEMEVTGEVPFDTAKEFQVDLKSMTDGKGIFEMEFLEYRKARQG